MREYVRTVKHVEVTRQFIASHFCNAEKFINLRLKVATEDDLVHETISDKKHNRGYCPICEQETIFVEFESWLRDYYKCINCMSIPRGRALVRTLHRFVPDWKEKVMHECSPKYIFIEYFGERCCKYTYSRYLEDVPCGTVVNGVRCENLENLTFADECIDIFITQDVLEHVMNPTKALSEISRVLKVGGWHIFTVPIYESNEKTIQKATIDAKGDVLYLSEPEYHAEDLVTYHHGIDIVGKIPSNMQTTIMLERDRQFGIDGEFLHVFACKKVK